MRGFLPRRMPFASCYGSLRSPHEAACGGKRFWGRRRRRQPRCQHWHLDDRKACQHWHTSEATDSIRKNLRMLPPMTTKRRLWGPQKTHRRATLGKILPKVMTPALGFCSARFGRTETHQRATLRRFLRRVMTPEKASKGDLRPDLAEVEVIENASEATFG